MAETTGSAKKLTVVVVTPEKAVLETQADFVVLPMFDGELGVLPGRAPFVGQLGPGELRIKTGESTKILFLDGGFAQVRGNNVNVLTQFARKSEDLTDAAISAEKSKADSQPANNVAEKATKLKLVARAKGLEKLKAKTAAK